MAAFNGCLGYVNQGDAQTKMPGVTLWNFGEKAKIASHQDSDIPCTEQHEPGGVTGSGRINCNLKTGGGPPLRAGDKVALELHVDDSGQNYIDIPEAVIEEMVDMEVDISDGTKVITYSYSFMANSWTLEGALAPAAP